MIVCLKDDQIAVITKRYFIRFVFGRSEAQIKNTYKREVGSYRIDVKTGIAVPKDSGLLIGRNWYFAIGKGKIELIAFVSDGVNYVDQVIAICLAEIRINRIVIDKNFGGRVG